MNQTRAAQSQRSRPPVDFGVKNTGRTTWIAPVMTFRAGLLHLALAASLMAGCSREDQLPATNSEIPGSGAIRLQDDAAGRGVSFSHSADGLKDYFFPSIMTGGAALLDLDQDGDLDVLLLNSRRTGDGHAPETSLQSKFYRQLDDGRFADATAGSGLDGMGFAAGCTAGDVNNDGRTDIYVTAYGRDQLFLNQGDGLFRDVSETAGVTNDRWGTSAAFLDYDRDGWLDIFVANYIEYDPGEKCVDNGGRQDFCNPAVFPRTSDRLYRNLTGDEPSLGNVRFREVSLETGIATAKGAGLGAITADFNNDGWIDIYVANDGHGNFLWINQQNGTFEEQAVLKGVAYDAVGQGQGSMGLALGDLNDDGAPDLVVTNLDGESNAVYQSSGVGFAEVSVAKGVATATFGLTGFGTVLFDAENDGDLDLAVANGRVRRHSLAGSSAAGRNTDARQQTADATRAFLNEYSENSLVLRSDSGRFLLDNSALNPLDSVTGVGRGLCQGDADNDGCVDLLVTFLDRPAAFFVNRTLSDGRWLSVRVVEPQLGGRDAIGARVMVVAGDRRQYRWLHGGGSYQCVSDFRLHFGMGDAMQFDSIEVWWPEGIRESFPGGDTNRFLLLKRREGISP